MEHIKMETQPLPPPLPPLIPMPQADSLLIADWLRLVRLGAIIEFTMSTYGLVYWILWMSGFSLGRTGLYVISQMTSIVTAVGVWLIVSPEPNDRKRLGFARWVIKIGIIISFVLTVVLAVRHGITPPLSETKQLDWMSINMIQVIAWACWVLAYNFYLRNLSMRLDDRTLYTNFGVLMWIVGVVSVLVVLVTILSLIVSFVAGTKAGVEPTPAPIEVQKEVSIAFKIVLGSIISMFCLWGGWLMWRLSRRLNTAVEKVLVEREL